MSKIDNDTLIRAKHLDSTYSALLLAGDVGAKEIAYAMMLVASVNGANFEEIAIDRLCNMVQCGTDTEKAGIKARLVLAVVLELTAKEIQANKELY
jgi:hypothetical protein